MQFTSPSSKIIALAITFVAGIMSIGAVIFSTEFSKETLPDQTQRPQVNEATYCQNWAKENTIAHARCVGYWKLSDGQSCEWICEQKEINLPASESAEVTD